MATNKKWEFQARKLVEYGKYDVTMEYSDKGIIDESLIEVIMNLDIPEPWTFKAVNIATEGTEYEKVVYFGVASFDTIKPDCFLPRRLIRELQFRDTSSFVTVSPVIDPLPKGRYCKLKPQNDRFLDLLNELGAKVLLEQLLKTYSVLQLNQHIELCHDKIVYLLQVTELKPDNVVLIRDTDLEVEFDEADNKMITPQTPITPNPFVMSSSTPMISPSPSASEYDYIITDSDGENIVINGEDLPKTKVMKHKDRILKNKSTNSLTGEISDSNIQQPSPTSPHQQFQSLPSTSSSSSSSTDNNSDDIAVEGLLLPTTTPTDSKQCNHCLHYIPNNTYEMHELRCSKNANYKGIICSICNRVIAISDEDKHIHCKFCNNLYTKSTIEPHILLSHEKLKCGKCKKEFTGGEEYIFHSSNMKVCPVCELKLLDCEYDEHFSYCASKTMRCDYCRKYITFMMIEEHFYKCHKGKECPVKFGIFNPENEIEEEDDDEKSNEHEDDEDNSNDNDESSDDDKSSDKNSEENEYDDVKSEKSSEKSSDPEDSD